MTESPEPTDEELEHGLSRIEDEEEMRGPNPADPELPDADDGENDGGGDE